MGFVRSKQKELRKSTGLTKSSFRDMVLVELGDAIREIDQALGL